ncbi:hypothetical protein OU574_08225 [Escherichia coli]|nr:hypothetical protein [Escherichia coli]
MLTKYALVAVIVLFTVKERNIEFKAVLAYEPKK